MSAIFAGVVRLVRDPELRDAGGTPVADLRVAWNTRRKVDGEWTEVGNFANVSVFGRQADTVVQHLAKGRECFVSGELSIRQYEHDGAQRESVEINADRVRFVGSRSGSAAEPSGSADWVDPDDDSIPFLWRDRFDASGMGSAPRQHH